MLSIIIADDEADIIDLCKSLIDYPGVTIIGEARNGLELLDQIERLRPDAVITDICMPGMTGLELIERAKQSHPDVNFIVMSGYTDFGYAQTALRFGVWDYLLKPLKQAELNRVLEKLDLHLLEKRDRQQQSVSLRGELLESIGTLRERYLSDVWMGETAAPLPEIGDAPVFDFSGTRLQCLAFSVDSNYPATLADAPSLCQQASGTLDKILALARAACREACLVTDWPFAAMLLLYERDGAEGRCGALFKQTGYEVRVLNSQNHFIHLTAAASALMEGGAAQIPGAMRQAKAALKWRLDNKPGDVILYDAGAEHKLDRLAGFASTRWERELREAVECLDARAAGDVIKAAWAGRAPAGRYRFLEETVLCLNGALSRLPWVDAMPARAPLDIFDVLSGGHGGEEPALRLASHAAREIDACREYAQNRENGVVREAKQYVERCYAENITLNDVAKHVCLSASYFSTLFKQETGGGFVEYLQHVRVNHAKTLLKETKMRVADIVRQVGYRDIKFFNKVFYKETSVKPSEYRKFYS